MNNSKKISLQIINLIHKTKKFILEIQMVMECYIKMHNHKKRKLVIFKIHCLFKHSKIKEEIK
jgi:hypothetical protein